jgi:hypothetical protein
VEAADVKVVARVVKVVKVVTGVAVAATAAAAMVQVERAVKRLVAKAAAVKVVQW